MAFDINSFLEGFQKPEVYVGDANHYVVIAQNGANKLAMSLIPSQFVTPYNGTEIPCVGLGLRLIEIGNDCMFGGEFGRRNATPFKDSTGAEVRGFRLMKTFLPLMPWPCSTQEFRNYTDTKAFPSLMGWLTDKVTKSGGALAMSPENLLEAMIATVSKLEEKPLELFHLPGESPAWKQPPPPKYTYNKGSPFNSEEENENDDDD